MKNLGSQPSPDLDADGFFLFNLPVRILGCSPKFEETQELG